jgi:hypothetical protein
MLMQKVNKLDRSAVWKLAALICTLLISSPVISCPLLQVDSSKAACCPRTSTPAKHCPLVPTIAACPLSLSVEKVEKASVDNRPANFDTTYEVVLPAFTSVLPEPDTFRQSTDLYLLHRVLLI